MNTALVGITAGRKVGDRICSPGLHGTGVEGAAAAVFKTGIMGHSMVGGRWIFPADGAAGGDGHRCRHIIGRSAIHQDLRGRRGRRSWPGCQSTCRQYEENQSPAHSVVIPVDQYTSIIHRDRFPTEGFRRPTGWRRCHECERVKGRDSVAVWHRLPCVPDGCKNLVVHARWRPLYHRRAMQKT